MYPDIEWEYDKKGELKTENFDASDSLVCVLGYINREKYNNILPKVIEYKVEDNRIKYKVDFCEKIFDKVIDL